MPSYWKNSQLVDTQIITKYARAYLKSVFQRVEVIKAKQNANDTQDGTVNIFKKIFEIKGDEQKDRSRHSHHAMDAAVLTLIPGSAQREEILKKYYSALEQKEKFHDKPYRDFDITHILHIDENILINHISRDKALVPTKKKLRKRGKIQYKIVETLPERFKNKIEGKDYFKIFHNGKEMFKVPIYIEGDSIRGQLHKETFLGAIKVVERNEDGFAKKENGKYVIRKNKKGEEEIWKVVRVAIDELKKEDFEDPEEGKEVIVDDILRKHIKKQLDEGVSLDKVTDFQNKPIRHIRCKNFVQKTFDIKRHSHQSKHKHKQFLLAQNTQDGGNYLYLLYEGEVEKKIRKELKREIKREARIISLFDFSSSGFTEIKSIWNDNYYNKINEDIPLVNILKVGQRVIFYSKNKEELKEFDSKKITKSHF